MQCIKLNTNILQNSARGTKFRYNLQKKKKGQNSHLVSCNTQFTFMKKWRNRFLAKQMKQKLDNEAQAKKKCFDKTLLEAFNSRKQVKYHDSVWYHLVTDS